jgi:ATP-dependent RNA helicase DeaD
MRRTPEREFQAVRTLFVDLFEVNEYPSRSGCSGRRAAGKVGFNLSQETLGFAALGVDPAIMRALDEMGFEEPTPIQTASIPLLLQGRDLVGQAQTGTGKTAAYGIPVLQRLLPDIRRPQALVLAPTRELALQVADEMAKLGKYIRVRNLAICGGLPIERQIKALRAGVEVVVGTPGRIMDHLERKTLKLDQIRTLVLDEADEMLDMGFLDDIETIMSYLPEERQTICFSAVIPDPISRITKRYMKSPEWISIARKELTAATIEQAYFEIRERDKVNALTRIIDHEAISRCIIFCRTKRGCEELASSLQSRGYLAEAIHGDLSQSQRNRALSRFREGQVELLIATDVAARGLDVENVTHVINYDIAHSPEYHVHRVGRTGRAGREGTAFTLIHPREYRQLRIIERATKSKIRLRKVPTAADVAERALDMVGEKIDALVSSGAGGGAKYIELAMRLLEEHEPERLVAALVSVMAEPRGQGSAVSSSYSLSSLDDDGPRERRHVRSSGADGFADTGAEPGYTRLFVNIGARQRVTPADFVRTIAREADIPGSLIGAIDIHDDFTFVEVPAEVGRTVLDALADVSIRGRSVQAEPARPR